MPTRRSSAPYSNCRPHLEERVSGPGERDPGHGQSQANALESARDEDDDPRVATNYAPFVHRHVGRSVARRSCRGGIAAAKSKSEGAVRARESPLPSGDLDKAAAEFKESYETFPKPETLFNLAQTHRLLKNYEKAIFYYKQYLSSGDVDERDRKIVQDRIADLEKLREQQQRADATSKNQTAPTATAPPTTPPPEQAVTREADGVHRRRWYESKLGWGSPRRVSWRWAWALV
jgi:tetratricopeptide (TPR) repeat protein